MKTYRENWAVGDRTQVARAPRLGTITELFQSGAYVHRVVVAWDDGSETVESTGALVIPDE